jgi:enoyl-CoA hydratase/carnithine racemase
VSGAVTIRFDGPLAEIRISNPARLNAFTRAMLGELAQACDAVEAWPETRVLVLSADPARAFCAGADIGDWADMPPHVFARDWVRGGHRVFDRLARLPVPSIAAIGGHALGGGLELAAACDIRVMAPGATLGLPETGIGIVPGWSGTQRLARLLPEPVLKEMALFGRRLTAGRALALGFAAEVAEDARAAALALAGPVGAVSPRATEVAKIMIHAAAGEDRAAMIEALGGGMSAATADKAEGVAAFRAKRAPDFPGV